MNAPDRRAEETRARILEVAWDLFRQLGARTTIADVADKLGMSSANVYRFYASKQALSEAVCANQLGGMTAAARQIAEGPGTVPERVRAVLLWLNSAMRSQMLNELRVHEMVEIAIREHWASIDAFQEDTATIVAGLIAEGQAKGEFGPGDPGSLGVLTLCSCSCIHHPQLIAKFGEEPPTPEDIADFALRALGNLKPLSPSAGA